jgi:hypothetical protein
VPTGDIFLLVYQWLTLNVVIESIHIKSIPAQTLAKRPLFSSDIPLFFPQAFHATVGIVPLSMPQLHISNSFLFDFHSDYNLIKKLIQDQ